jgi:5-methylcytosine-specific restriction enzyme A
MRTAAMSARFVHRCQARQVRLTTAGPLNWNLLMPWGPFTEQSIYNRRRDIHAAFDGQQQGGICTPSRHPLVIAFTGETGEQHGYRDGWSPEGTFRYYGEGQIGDMVFDRGNRAVRDHAADGKDLLPRR